MNFHDNLHTQNLINHLINQTIYLFVTGEYQKSSLNYPPLQPSVSLKKKKSLYLRRKINKSALLSLERKKGQKLVHHRVLFFFAQKESQETKVYYPFHVSSSLLSLSPHDIASARRPYFLASLQRERARARTRVGSLLFALL